MTLTRFLWGLLALAAIAAPALAAARVARRRWLPDADRVTGWLGEVSGAITIVLVVSELAGVVGAFRLPVVIVGVASVAASVLIVDRRRGDAPVRATNPAPAASPPGRRTNWMLALALVASALVLLQWGTRAARAYDTGDIDGDSLQYHLPHAVEFVQTHSTTELNVVSFDPLHSFHPANSELLTAVGILAFGREILSPLLSVVWLALGLTACWAIGQRRGAGPLLLLCGCVLFGLPILSSTAAGYATTDAPSLCFLLIAFALLLEDSRSGGRLAFAGAAAGLAIGTKLTVLTGAAGLLALVLVTAPERRRVRDSTVFTGAALVAGGFWFARNLVRTGSPVPALDLGVGPIRLPHPPLPSVDSYGHTVLEYLGDGGVWRDVIRPGVPLAFGRAGWFIVVAGAVALVFALWRGTAIERAVALGAVALTAGYLANPLSAFGPEGDPSFFFFIGLRYLIPALLLSAVAGVFCLSARARAPVFVAILVLFGVTQFTRHGVPAWIDGYKVRGAVLAALVVVLLGARYVVHRWRERPAELVAAAVLVAGVAIGVGAPAADRYLSIRYTVDTPGFSRGSPFSELFRRMRTNHDLVIGYVWMEADFPLYGDDLSNRPTYVGVDGPHGAFRDARTCREWREAVNRRDLDLLVVAPLSTFPAVGPPPMLEWTDGAEGVRQEFEIGDIHVFRVTGPMDPSTCP